MPRRHHRERAVTQREHLGSGRRNETFGGQQYDVQSVTSDREYRCPGCDQLVRPPTRHVVAWLATGDGSDRRHWHAPCWAARERRAALPPRRSPGH